jgi:hypothetical protein
MFDKKKLKYKDCLGAIFFHCPLEIINLNTTLNHIFSHSLKNFLINIIHIVDLKFVDGLFIV